MSLSTFDFLVEKDMKKFIKFVCIDIISIKINYEYFIVNSFDFLQADVTDYLDFTL